MDKLRAAEVMYLKGIGPARAKLLESELGIKTCADLLRHFPTSYVDRSRFHEIRELDRDVTEQPAVQVRGRFVSFVERGEGAKRRLVGLFADGRGGLMECVWFNSLRRIREMYTTGVDYVVFGRPAWFGTQWSMTHPEVDRLERAQTLAGLRGVYPLTQKLRQRGVSSRNFRDWTEAVLSRIGPQGLRETLPPEVVAGYRLMGLAEAMREVHAPTSLEALEAARRRVKFEELFYLHLSIQSYARRRRMSTPGLRMGRVGEAFNGFYRDVLPYALTGAQKRVMHEIHADMASGRQMNRLLQGDVGSGKTLVALMAMLLAVDSGHQAALMAPTEILAEQHYQTLRQWVAPLGISVGLLTGSTRRAAREAIHAGLQDGSMHIIVGTHALIEDPVKWRSLGLAVIDEQHRFGVVQRARLWAKGEVAPHVLVMTATPIPRTLAMTVYGDLDVSVIDELPPGRKPIATELRYEEQRLRVWQGLSRQLDAGRQAYIVYPLIDQNEKLDYKSLMEGYDTVCETFRTRTVAMVHGRMKADEKERQMQLFASGKAQILVATTVIEVGVNVPNASVMIIENAERFGLSQLHQLRGRVGRGADQSYCILMTRQKLSRDSRRRLQLMTETTDGFRIAEADMKWRGPGDIEGTMQSGTPFELRMANLATDGLLVAEARRAVDALLDADPGLETPSGRLAAAEMARAALRPGADFSRVS